MVDFLSKAMFFQDISWFCQIQGPSKDLENEFVIFQDFQNVWEPCSISMIVKIDLWYAQNYQHYL